MGWPVPVYGHVPLIHGADGSKLSKRHGALAVEAYRDMGYLPEAMRNYLLRLGWSHGDDEIIPTAKAIEWFDFGGLGKSAARFDIKKLDSLNGQYIRDMDDSALVLELVAFAERQKPEISLEPRIRARLKAAMPLLKTRAKTLVELADKAEFLFSDGPRTPDSAAAPVLTPDARAQLGRVAQALDQEPWDTAALEGRIRALAEKEGAKLGDLAQPLRVAITGRTASPPIFEVLTVLGREEALTRIRAHVE
jgi:glutamyl-tRNA synthetase